MGDDMRHLPQPSAHTNSLTKRENSSVKRVLSDHSTLSESIKAAGDLLEQFPNAKSHSNGFIGALSQVLMQYSRQTVTRCIDVRKGLARSAEFISLASVVAWCERDERPLHEDAAREDRIARQFTASEGYHREQEERTARLTYDELKVKYGDGKGGWLGEGGSGKYQVSEEEKALLLEDAKRVGNEISGIRMSQVLRKSLDASARDIIDDESHGSVASPMAIIINKLRGLRLPSVYLPPARRPAAASPAVGRTNLERTRDAESPKTSDDEDYQRISILNAEG